MRPNRIRTLGRWNDTDVRVLRAACECAPCRAAFFAVFALAVAVVGVGFVGTERKSVSAHRRTLGQTLLHAALRFCCSH